MTRKFVFLIVATTSLCCALPAQAQLMLPGAAPSTPAGAAPAPAGGQKPAKKPAKAADGTTSAAESGGVAITRAPGEETVAGRQFQRNGSAGVMGMEKPAGKPLQISRLVFSGYQISRPTEVCRVEVDGANVSLKPESRYQGLISFEVETAGCTFSLDILEGAARVRGRTCEFRAADCTADPSGVWGPPGNSIGEAESKAIEKLRGKADKDARAGFRVLLRNAGHDRALARQIVREQASFSSLREETCRDYAGEDKHGFCASRVTLARAVALSAQLRGDAAGGEDKPAPAKKKPRPKTPKPATLAAPAPGLPPPGFQ